MSAKAPSSRPRGSKTRPVPAASSPSSSEGATTGNARMFARIVESGTSWNQKSSTGVTPTWAASVAPAASATVRGRKRRRSAIGVASATIPAVAATESWNPTAHTRDGSSMRTPTPAPASTDPELLGRPSSTPISASPAITPARITEGSAPVSTTKNATVPSPSANRGHLDHRRAPPSASTGSSTIATFPPETTSRCDRPLGDVERALDGQPVAAHAGRRVAPTGEPHRLANRGRALVPADRADVQDRRPPVAFEPRIDPERALHGAGLRRQAREQRVADAVLVRAPPSDRQQERRRQGERSGAKRPPGGG